MCLYGTHSWNNATKQSGIPKETNIKLPLLHVHRHTLSFILPTHGCSFIHSIPPLSVWLRVLHHDTGILAEGRREWVGRVLGKCGMSCNQGEGRPETGQKGKAKNSMKTRFHQGPWDVGVEDATQSKTEGKFNHPLINFAQGRSWIQERREGCFSILPDPRTSQQQNSRVQLP